MSPLSSATSSSSSTDPLIDSSSSSTLKTTAATTAATITSTNKKSLLLWKYLQECFQGDFDNYHQVVQDRARGLLPREGGGHEHIHCTLLPLDVIHRPYARLAAFYFDGLPQRIFRFRYYELTPTTTSDDDDNDAAVITQLYLLHPQLEGILRGEENPMEWPRLFDAFTSPNDQPKTRLLLDCDVQWTLEKDDIQQGWEEDISTRDDHGIHAVMLHGEALVDSTMFPGSKIRVMDQLSLWLNHFWIHDRGFDPSTGAFIYGNQAGVPYRLERVANIQQGKRHVVNTNLQWTLGPLWRTAQEYETNMMWIGGVSTKMNT